jgi:uncharacterized protein YyaL (SSP411 family)
VYSDDRVAKFVHENFIPVKIHIKEQPQVFKRFDALWTPTLLVLDPQGVERHRIEGFLASTEFLAQLELGLARSAFANQKFEAAEKQYRSLAKRGLEGDVAPEAIYWAGVSHYKASGDGTALGEAQKALEKQFPDSVWARKASVWKPAEGARSA